MTEEFLEDEYVPTPGEQYRVIWFAVCDYCGKHRLRVWYWWHEDYGAADTSCKRCRKRNGTWSRVKGWA